MLLTGAVLWWPRLWRWGVVRNQLWFRRGLPTAQARHYNWHHVLSVWCLAPLLGVVLSGVLMSYPSVSGPVYDLLGASDSPGRGAPPQAASAADVAGGGAALPLDDLVALGAAEAGDWTWVSVALPGAGSAPVSIAFDGGNGVQTSRIETYLVTRDGSGVAQVPPPPGSPQRFVRFLHTGEIFGLAGQTIAGLASLGAMVLVYTGLSLGLRRLRRMTRASGASRRAAGG